MHISSKYIGVQGIKVPVQESSTSSTSPTTMISRQTTELKADVKQQYLCLLNTGKEIAFFFSHPYEILFDEAGNKMSLVFYPASHKGLIKNTDNVAFVMAGRKKNALLPIVNTNSTARCVIVVTEDEFNEISPGSNLIREYDFLVIKSFDCAEMKDSRPGALTNRRRATLLFSHHLKLEQIIMMDDNIETFYCPPSHNEILSGLDLIFAQMSLQQGLVGEPIISISTASNLNHAYNLQTLGSKVFMINMNAIRENLPEARNCLALFPENEQAWGEDYFMQIASNIVLSDKL